MDEDDSIQDQCPPSEARQIAIGASVLLAAMLCTCVFVIAGDAIVYDILWKITTENFSQVTHEQVYYVFASIATGYLAMMLIACMLCLKLILIFGMAWATSLSGSDRTL